MDATSPPFAANSCCGGAATPQSASCSTYSAPGAVLGLAFWLREATGNNVFYAVVWLCYPLLVPGHWEPLSNYIEWWVVEGVHTVGPG